MDTTTLPTPTLRRSSLRRSTKQDEPLFRLRVLAAGDAATLDSVFDGLSARSRYLRFHGPVPRLTANVRRMLLDVDGERHVAVAAEVWSGSSWSSIGIGRVIRTGPAVGELAVEIVDEWQGRGVGRRLLESLRDLARSAAYRELHAEVLLENAAILGLLRRVFPEARMHSAGDGSGTVVCPLGGHAAAFDAVAAAFDPVAA
jgi:GNAT superfamily N-acetyltransferase